MIRFSHSRNSWQFYKIDRQDSENSQWIDISVGNARKLSLHWTVILT